MNKIIGSTLIAAGTAIGASMLAFPMVAAGPGFIPTTLLFIFMWGTMYVSALLTLEANLAFKAPNNSYPTMAQATLGKPGRILTYVSSLSLLYLLVAAYITGGGSLFEAVCLLMFEKAPPSWVNQLLFTLVLGSVVAFGTRAVDLFNRSLFSLKLILLGLIFAFFLPQMDVTALFSHNEPQYIWAALPVIVTAFGFHIVIPSLASYLQYEVSSLKTVLLSASLLPLIIYIFWVAALLGTLPYEGEMGFKALAQGDGSVASLMLAINHARPTPWLNGVINAFATLAIVTSFLGVSLGLFDCLQDANKAPHRLRTVLLTFLPPLLLVIFYPEGFVALISFASIFVAIILVIIPVFMVYSMRRNPQLSSSYRVAGGNVTLMLVLILGIAFIVIEVLRQCGLLDMWA